MAAHDAAFPFEDSRVKELQAILNAETDIGAILRSQPILEEILTDFQSRSLVKPEFIRRRSLSFKLDPLEALGLLVPDHHQLLQAIIDMRNRIAHNLEYKVSESDLERSLDGMSPRMKASYLGAMKVAPDPQRFSSRLRTLLLSTFIGVEFFYGGAHRLELDALTKQFRELVIDWS